MVMCVIASSRLLALSLHAIALDILPIVSHVVCVAMLVTIKSCTGTLPM